jgi:hypothetical protein
VVVVVGKRQCLFHTASAFLLHDSALSRSLVVAPVSGPGPSQPHFILAIVPCLIEPLQGSPPLPGQNTDQTCILVASNIACLCRPPIDAKSTVHAETPSLLAYRRSLSRYLTFVPSIVPAVLNNRTRFLVSHNHPSPDQLLIVASCLSIDIQRYRSCSGPKTEGNKIVAEASEVRTWKRNDQKIGHKLCHKAFCCTQKFLTISLRFGT